jgi:hypothetical protein
MKNPFKRDDPAHDDDNPLVPNAVERPAERAAARARTRDNPLVPDAIERPVERAVADDVGVAPNRSSTIDRPGVNDGPGDRPGVRDTPADIARGRSAAAAPAVDRPFVNDGPGDRPGVIDSPSDIARGAAAGSTTVTDDTHHMDLFPEAELGRYRAQWESIQAGFVDEPRGAVQQADALVSEMSSRLAELFTRERSTLEGQWTKGDNVSTEDLRIALKRYRSFFHRLLSM